MKTNTARFSESLDLVEPTPDEQETYARHVKTYSTQALKQGSLVDRCIVNHSQFTRAVTAMERAFQLAPEFETPQGIVMVGPPGTGKTATFNYFRATLPKSSLFADGEGAIGLRCPKAPRVGTFVTGLLKVYRYPFTGGNAKQMYIRRHVLFDAIQQKGTRLIFIDESQHLLYAPHTKVAEDSDTEVSEFLKDLMDTCRVALVLAGSRELNRLQEADSALASRLSVKETLTEIPLDAEWMGILKTFSRQCPNIDQSAILAPEMAMLLHKATSGNLRSLKRLLLEAVLLTADSLEAAISKATLSRAFTLVSGSAEGRVNVFV
ncbi:TniB family NTP-binding protein [Leptospira sp. 96542]|nr:TniB family NTP-binding protein [Leptospira sp. 96542]